MTVVVVTGPLHITPPPHPNRGARYCDERVSVCQSITVFVNTRLRVQSLSIFARLLPMAAARSLSGGVAIRYTLCRPILPVLPVTSYLHMMGRVGHIDRYRC